MTKRKALIADDHSLYRQGLKRLLIEELNFDEVLEASSLSAAIAILETHDDIELTLADLHMPGVDGVSSFAALKQRFPGLRVALVTASEAKADIMAAMSLGMSGFIPKNLPNREVVLALETISKGHIFVPSVWLDPFCSTPPLERRLQQATPCGSIESKLTQRQRDVLECLKNGLTNRQIAEDLKISVGTVKIHVASVMNLLGVSNRIQVAVSDRGKARSPSRHSEV